MNKIEALSYSTANNWVVVKPAVRYDKITHGTLELDAPAIEHDRVKTTPVICQVMIVPRKLRYGTKTAYFESIAELDLPPEVLMSMHKARKEAKFSEITTVTVPISNSMPWKTTMDLRYEDIVWVNPHSIREAEDKGNTIEVEGEKWYFIKYSECYIKKADDQIKCLNGWILLDLINETDQWMKRAEKIGLHIPAIMKKQQFNDRLALVTHAGPPSEYVLNDRFDYPEIQVGDVVLLKWKVNRRLETYVKTMQGYNDLIVSRRCNVMAIME